MGPIIRERTRDDDMTYSYTVVYMPVQGNDG
jgi:hypothetical protein